MMRSSAATSQGCLLQFVHSLFCRRCCSSRGDICLLTFGSHVLLAPVVRNNSSDPIKQTFTCDRVLAQTKGQLCVTKYMSAFYLVCEEVMIWPLRWLQSRKITGKQGSGVGRSVLDKEDSYQRISIYCRSTPIVKHGFWAEISWETLTSYSASYCALRAQLAMIPCP